MRESLSKAYDPKTTEQKIYNLWLKSGFFNPDKLPKRHKKPFAIVIPPPNVTGELHMGHTLQHVMHDIIIRKKRMEGYKTLWLPGTDHAGIATQNKVEQKLKKEGKTRFDLGREKFIEEVWKWKEQYGNIILDQMKKLGNSCDWSRAVFTMDSFYAKKVLDAFVHYYNKNWIVRAERVVNWCVRCKTSLSDLELEYKEEKGKLWYIRYPLKAQTNADSTIVVATTRPETMLGDEAVAVNPADKRFKHLVGQKIILPIQQKEIPIVADYSVDPNFGTGLVKVTPAHDITDYEIAMRHNLPLTQIVEENGRLNARSKVCDGLTAEDCRQKVVETLGAQGFIEKEEPYTHNVAHCYRCSSTVEPMPSWQWFLKMSEGGKNSLAEVAKRAVRRGEVQFVPKRWKRTYFAWLGNIRDWCISRQLWWGHQIPVWYCGGISRVPQLKMGFHKDVVPQIFKGKTKTYRLRDHGFKVGDRVLFENSQARRYFGYGIIKGVAELQVNQIDFKDKAHYKIYKSLTELIAAFKLRNPDKEVTRQSKAYLYEYEFHTFTKKDAESGCGQAIASITKPRQCPACKGVKLEQDKDVLDTWFSSALWPFAVFKTQKDKKQFFPTQVLITDRGIINLWVARMIFSSYEFLGVKPFSDVIIHATVLAKDGQRMSKSLGTGVDPLGLIEKYGADATRFGMIYQAMGGQDIRFAEEHIIAGRKFCNKLWNIARFALMQIDTSKVKSQKSKLQPQGQNLRTTADKKIYTQLQKTITTVDKYLEQYKFGHAAHALYDFVWHDFADVYIEESKKEKNEKVLLYVLTETLKLLQPFIPFITEEIYQIIPLKKKSLLFVEQWPK